MITELSRPTQLDEKRLNLIDKATANAGVLVADLAADIRAGIATLDAGSMVKASGWYVEANLFAQYLAKKYNTSVEIAAGVISAVSPRMAWLRNKAVADAILATYRLYSAMGALDAARHIGLGLSTNVAIAVRIARGEDISYVLTGTKRRSFYNNIIAPLFSDSVTVDTWMTTPFVNTAGMDKKAAQNFLRKHDDALGGTGVGYFLIADAVRAVADEMDIVPSQVQAMYWIAVSGDFNGGRPDIINA